MGRAKLSGALLVSKIPPNAGRSVQYLRPVPDDGDPAAFSAEAAPPAVAAGGNNRKIAFWIAAGGAVAFAVASVTALALLLPTGLDGMKPSVSISLPPVATKLAKTALDSALRVPAFRPAAIALTGGGAEPESPPAAAGTAALAPDRPPAVPTPASSGTSAPTATPAPAPGAPPAAAAATSPDAASLRAHGDAAFAAGRLPAAREFYRHAADAGDGQAALQLGETYDPAFLALAGLSDERGDVQAAAYWYHRAEKLGKPNAATLLRGLAAEIVNPPSR